MKTMVKESNLKSSTTQRYYGLRRKMNITIIEYGYVDYL